MASYRNRKKKTIYNLEYAILQSEPCNCPKQPRTQNDNGLRKKTCKGDKKNEQILRPKITKPAFVNLSILKEKKSFFKISKMKSKH